MYNIFVSFCSFSKISLISFLSPKRVYSLSRNKKIKSKSVRLIKSRNFDIMDDLNKEESSPCLRCVRCPKVEIFVEMVRAKL